MGSVTAKNTFRRSEETQFVSGGAPGPADGKLMYVRVDFQREMRGDLERREITFEGQVHCVSGPVAAWDEPLYVDGLSRLPEDTVILDAATLRVNQWRREGAQWLGMEAEGNVHVEAAAKSGLFTARGALLTYDQSKDLFILRGGAGMVELVREETLGGRPQEAFARAVHFSPSRNEVKLQDAQRFSGDF